MGSEMLAKCLHSLEELAGTHGALIFPASGSHVSGCIFIQESACPQGAPGEDSEGHAV